MFYRFQCTSLAHILLNLFLCISCFLDARTNSIYFEISSFNSLFLEIQLVFYTDLVFCDFVKFTY